MSDPGALAELIKKSGGRMVAFSGAGMSTESGIPDYRSPGGIWSRHKPVLFNEFLASRQARERYWRFYEEWYPGFATARPHQGHLALGSLYRAGLLQAVVTQNVDGLHEAGGVPASHVLELHGNVHRTNCLGPCGYSESTPDALGRFTEGGEPLECPECGAPLKPATISFGQNLDSRVLRRAADLSAQADPLVVIGSSLAVTPAADLPMLTLENHGALVIINRDPTHLDGRAALVFREPAGEVLAKAAEMALAD